MFTEAETALRKMAEMIRNQADKAGDDETANVTIEEIMNILRNEIIPELLQKN